ncbi:sulfatase family protein [Pontiella agarivorans]|uniref:Sulfatase-like hydrolase/transferase n=1 Tax=Pontiella agarivorans TaxID=3038953 RepID=A0ABU5MZX1_9BACT|nr:sulfatase-like hydrolase/transferase [Pontiella agarivorans]MDZ8119736.1 sulfatase-like hydrolase/transferase [Pontiella agarivorans]
MNGWSLFVGFLFMVGTVCADQLPDGQQEKPNIILMMCDDLGWGDVGFNGNSIIQTPQLDHLAEKGAVLTHFYSVGPVCSPTRASFLTGRHYYRMGVWTANKGHLPKEEYTLARMLKKQGYATGHFGKWHLGTLSRTVSAKGKGRRPDVNFAPPWQRDYDESFVTESAVCTWDPGLGKRAVNNPYYHNGKPVDEPPVGCDSRVIMDKAISFIRGAVNAGKPFVAVIWFHAPHEDIKAGPEYLKMYEGYGEAAHYYGCITAVDDQVGRLCSELEDLGITENTALFFCSDNGPEGGEPEDRLKTRRAGSSGPFSGRKRSMFDGGVRVPGMAVWPGRIAPGSRIDVPMSVLDYLPTVCEMTGAELLPNRELDGQNILPILLGEQAVHEKSIPFRFRQYAGLVEGTFKLIIESPTDASSDRLFDLSNDVAEQNNVVSRYPEKAQRMRRQILEFMASAQKSHRGDEYDAGDYSPVDPWQELGKPADQVKRRMKSRKSGEE